MKEKIKLQQQAKALWEKSDELYENSRKESDELWRKGEKLYLESKKLK